MSMFGSDYINDLKEAKMSRPLSIYYNVADRAFGARVEPQGTNYLLRLESVYTEIHILLNQSQLNELKGSIDVTLKDIQADLPLEG